ncbi:CAP domain-containing protein [Mycolicibacterium brumae]|uniref:CAP domain-containing protein n=1 Tax=Mycolicibacterium brumae TaxID=85968 RepID=UPI000FF9F8B7|nr:CAP domain-containing protein [Mycolicibacterium brumae]RWA16096.1 hypothetical protein MBRU_08275 [Mycolicibacterium brumae DSM 44177]UWW09508.1 CAP domain-containing protein [Mycolicibacterium brumae]
MAVGLGATCATIGAASLLAGSGTAVADPNAVLAQINDDRAAGGCGPLTMNGRLVAAAQRHADDLASSGAVSHSGGDGSTVGSRIQDAGYAAGGWAENIYRGGGDPVSGWMNSPGHRQNMLNCSYTEAGLAQSGGGDMTYYVADFASP